jgi:hypothetical protein
VIVAIFRRRLREGKTFADFKEAWEAERGFGVPARVIAATELEDPMEVLTVGFVDIDPRGLAASADDVAELEAQRHSRIDEVIESTELKAFYLVQSEHDFSAVPREIAVGSRESILDLREAGARDVPGVEPP